MHINFDRTVPPVPEPAPTREQIHSVLEVAFVIGECIQAAGQIPSGHLFADLQVAIPGLTLATYDSIIRKFVEAKLVTRKFHLIKWIGTKKPVVKS